jgi:hypothetical protein
MRHRDMTRSSSPVRFGRLALVAGVAALFTAACGTPNPTAPSLLTAAGSTAQKGGASKVDVCHLNDTGGFQLLNVNSSALSAHLGHGDGQPNGPVPGSTMQVFGATCQVIQLKKYTVTLVSGNGGGTGSLDSAVTYAKASGGTGSAVILDTHGAYASLPGARWISWKTVTEGFSKYGAPHTGDDITYSIGFNLPAGATNVSVSGTFYADNRGSGALNGALLGAHPAGFGSGFNTPVSFSSSSGFLTGANTLKFTVEDQGGISGLTFKATITYYAQ